MKKWKKNLLIGVEKTVKFTCAVSHLGLKYAMDNVENNEAFVMKVLWGVDEQQTIKERQIATVHTQLDIKRKVDDMKNTIRDYTVVFNKEGSDINVYHETI